MNDEIFVNEYGRGLSEVHQYSKDDADAAAGWDRIACHRYVSVEEGNDDIQTQKPAEKEKVWPCEHIKLAKKGRHKWVHRSEFGECGFNSEIIFCPQCGARRPSEKASEQAKVDWEKVKVGTKIVAKQHCLIYSAIFIAFDQGLVIAWIGAKVASFRTCDCQLAEGK